MAASERTRLFGVSKLHINRRPPTFTQHLRTVDEVAAARQPSSGDSPIGRPSDPAQAMPPSGLVSMSLSSAGRPSLAGRPVQQGIVASVIDSPEYAVGGHQTGSTAQRAGGANPASYRLVGRSVPLSKSVDTSLERSTASSGDPQAITIGTANKTLQPLPITGTPSRSTTLANPSNLLHMAASEHQITDVQHTANQPLETNVPKDQAQSVKLDDMLSATAVKTGIRPPSIDVGPSHLMAMASHEASLAQRSDRPANDSREVQSVSTSQPAQGADTTAKGDHSPPRDVSALIQSTSRDVITEDERRVESIAPEGVALIDGGDQSAMDCSNSEAASAPTCAHNDTMMDEGDDAGASIASVNDKDITRAAVATADHSGAMAMDDDPDEVGDACVGNGTLQQDTSDGAIVPVTNFRKSKAPDTDATTISTSLNTDSIVSQHAQNIVSSDSMLPPASKTASKEAKTFEVVPENMDLAREPSNWPHVAAMEAEASGMGGAGSSLEAPQAPNSLHRSSSTSMIDKSASLITTVSGINGSRSMAEHAAVEDSGNAASTFEEPTGRNQGHLHNNAHHTEKPHSGQATVVPILAFDTNRCDELHAQVRNTHVELMELNAYSGVLLGRALLVLADYYGASQSDADHSQEVMSGD